MNTLNLIPFVYENLILFILTFARISALFTTFVFFRKDFVNARIIIALTSVLSFYVILLSPHQTIHYEVFSLPMMIQLFFQVFIGFVAGLILNIVFEIFTAFGQIISTQIGYSMVTLIDPRFGAITPLTLFYFYVAMLIFLQLNGHLIICKLILDSFSVLPVTNNFFPQGILREVVNFSQAIFSGSVFLSVAVIISILLANMAIAVMTRFAPQFNLFTIGINISMILGLICIYITFNLFVNSATDILQNGFTLLQNLILQPK